MEKHRTALGALFAINGLLGVFGMLVVAAIFGFGGFMAGTAAAQDPGVPPFVPYIPLGVGLLVVAFIAIFAIPCLIIAFGLFTGQPWSRPFALVVGILNLPAFPLGTVMGVYAIWYFVQDEPVTARA